MLDYNKNLKGYSRNLRNNMTDAEIRLWSALRGKQINGVQFYRQKPIGNYIADFYSASTKLVIELDGGQHYTEVGKKKDKIRDEYFKSVGIKVLRFSDRDVLLNIEGVLQVIWEETKNPP